MDKEYLIKKWLNDDLTREEMETFKQLDDYDANLEILDNAKHFKASHFSELNDFNTFRGRYHALNTPVKKLNWFKPLLRIASVVVIALGLYFTLFYNSQTKIETLASEKRTIVLPDQSEVMLNALSEIAYNKNKWEDDRKINLKGEAFFKVAKGKTFDVITANGLVTVIGTQFNVKQRENYFEVKCYEGVVRVTSDTLTRQLLAGNTFKIINSNFNLGNTSLSIPEWTANRSSFESIPFSEVLAELERQYNVRINATNVETGRLFSGGFMHDNLDNALISITQPMNLTYEINASNVVVIHGSKM